jgi:hypothetical protein
VHSNSIDDERIKLMRKKALLAGASSDFKGPWVNLDPGEWLVEPSPDVSVDTAAMIVDAKPDGTIIRGPTRIRAIVSPDYDGPGVFLVAKQISINGDSS